MKVFVYFNLHKHVWSLKALQGPMRGRVIAHAEEVALENCTFKVHEAGRQRVLKNHRKNVHAGIVGTISALEPFNRAAAVQVGYNPYKGPDFYETESGETIHTAQKVILQKDRRVFVVK